MTVKFKNDSQGSEDTDHLYIAGLPSPCSIFDVKALFDKLGLEVKWSRVQQDTWETGCCTAVVQVASMEDACMAIASLDGKKYDDALDEAFPVQDLAEASSPSPLTALATAPGDEAQESGQEQPELKGGEGGGAGAGDAASRLPASVQHLLKSR